MLERFFRRVENLAGHGAYLLFPQQLFQLRAHRFQLDVLGRQQALALDNDELACGGNDLRHLAVRHLEGRLLDFLVVAVLADGVDQSAQAGAVGVLGELLSQVGERVGMCGCLGLDLAGQLRVAAGDQPARLPFGP